MSRCIPSFHLRMAWRVCLTFVIFLSLTSNTSADLNNETSPTHSFKTRPDIHAPIIDLRISRPELISPGYLFLAPYRNVAPGPYIYDNDGELVWAGAGSGGPKTAHMPHVCQYRGEDHLCYFQGDQHHGFARGFGVIMDNSYRIVKTLESSGAGTSSDMHEFRMTPYSDSKTAILTVYQPRQYDLTVNPRYNIQNGMGWIIDSVFQEIEIDTGRVLFEWRSLDHVDPELSWVMPGTTDTSGSGLDTFRPWDYFHVNSVDKNRDGDYLISARHTCALYKISGQDGSIMWQLGGSNPTIDLQGFTFGYQHEARWIAENATHSVISFFDNAGNAYNHTGEYSRGVIISVDHFANVAYLLKSWGAPEPRGGMRSGSQGNMQLLPNGGCLIGWGEHAYFSEHLEDGSAVMYGRLAERESNVMMYRTYKFNWTAQPITKPVLWTYSKSNNGSASMHFYVSWNGATEVRSWRFHVGSSVSGPFSFAGEMWRTGFETEFAIDEYNDWAYAEAVDGNGRVLSHSPVMRTFVPSPTLAEFCNDRGDCAGAEEVPENFTTPYTAQISTDEQFLSTSRAYNTANYYVNSLLAATAGSIHDVVYGLISTPHQAASHRAQNHTLIWVIVLTVTCSGLIFYLRRSRSRYSVGRQMAAIQSVFSPSKHARRDSEDKEELEMLSTPSRSSSER